MLGGANMSRLRVPRSLYQGMIGHAALALPAEAVGLLGGSDGQVRRRIPLPNVLGAKCFLADPYAQFQALRQFSAEGLVPLAVYHSHPGGGVRPSAVDLLFANRLPYLQLVIAIGRAHNPAVDIAAYAMTEAAIEEVWLEVVPD
jgi:proteasome lid subunit RPN8/RPN11